MSKTLYARGADRGLRCCALGDIPPRSLHCRDLFPDRPTQHMLTDGSPRKRTIAPGKNHPSDGLKHPRGTLSSSCSVQRRDRDGVVVTDGGTSGTPTRFHPVWVWVGWAGKAAAWDIAHPRQCPGHKRGRGRRVKRRTVVGIEGVAGAGASHRALCGAVVPFRAGPRKTRPPMDPPAKEPVPHERTTRARAPNTPRISALEERATLVVARRGWPSPHNHHHIAPPPLDIIHMTLEIGSGRAGARDNVGGAYGGPSTGRPWSENDLRNHKSDSALVPRGVRSIG